MLEETWNQLRQTNEFWEQCNLTQSGTVTEAQFTAAHVVIQLLNQKYPDSSPSRNDLAIEFNSSKSGAPSPVGEDPPNSTFCLTLNQLIRYKTERFLILHTYTGLGLPSSLVTLLCEGVEHHLQVRKQTNRFQSMINYLFFDRPRNALANKGKPLPRPNAAHGIHLSTKNKKRS
jgi:hypothetical protein